MSRVAIDLGFIQIYWYSIMIAIALLVGLTVTVYTVELIAIPFILESYIVPLLGFILLPKFLCT